MGFVETRLNWCLSHSEEKKKQKSPRQRDVHSNGTADLRKFSMEGMRCTCHSADANAASVLTNRGRFHKQDSFFEANFRFSFPRVSLPLWRRPQFRVLTQNSLCESSHLTAMETELDSLPRHQDLRLPCRNITLLLTKPVTKFVALCRKRLFALGTVSFATQFAPSFVREMQNRCVTITSPHRS